MTKRKLALAAVLFVIAAASAVLALGTSPGSAKSNAAFKAAWIYVGPHNDGGWSQAHDQGRLAVQKALGSKVQTTYKENVPEGPQVAQVIDSLIRDGNKIIFATSFGFQPAMVAAAKKYPDVKFEMATGYLTSKNMAVYYGAGEDAIYLSGIAAGAATKTGTVGYVVPFAIPEVIRHTNAFALGVQKAHPGAKVKIIWTNSWFSPDKEKKAAENLHSAGADVIGQNVDSPAAGQYAESAKIPWVGYDSNAKKFAKNSWLTAAVYNWGPYYIKRDEGRDERHLEDRQLLRQHEGRVHAARAVRLGRLCCDEEADRTAARADRQRQVERVQRPDLRPEGQAAHQGRRARDRSPT